MGAVTADSVIVELEARTADYDKALTTSGQVTTKFGSDAAKGASQAEGAIVGSMRNIGSATGNANGTQLILQSIIRRTTDQFAAGAPLATIFAEHISALAEAGEMAGGSLGSLGALLQGPLGFALSAAASVAAVLATKFFEGADASEKLKEKNLALEDALTKAKFATDAATKSIAAYNAEQKHAIETDSLAADIALKLAENRLKEARANIASIQADIAKQRGVQISQTNGLGGNPALAADAALLRENKTRADVLDQTVRDLQIQIGKVGAASATDPVKRINDQFDRMRDVAIRAAHGNDALAKGITLTLGTIEKQRALALEAEKALHRHSRSADAVAEANAKLATATDEVGRAEARVELVRARRDKLTPAAYQAELTAALGAVNAAKAHEEAVKKDTAALAKFNEENNKLVLGLIRSNQELGRGLLPDAGKEFKEVADQLARAQHESVQEQAAGIEELHRRQEQSIRTLSGLYYDLFSGGTKNLWKDFERMGLEALAKLAAQKTFEAILNFGSQHSGDGGILGAIATAASSLKGTRAGGGPVSAGGLYLVGEKGPELLQMGASAGNIVPNQGPAMRSSGTQTIAGTVEHRIVIEPNEMFDTHVDTRVVGGIVQYAPVIIEGAKSATFAAASRPGLPRSAG